MEAASLAHGVASPLSPREGMIKNVSLESLQLCERDGKKPLEEHTVSDCVGYLTVLSTPVSPDNKSRDVFFFLFFFHVLNV